MTSNENNKEASRIREVYKKRDESGKTLKYSLFNPASLYILQKREADILRLLSRHGVNDLSAIRILDIGCGKGTELQNFIRYGAHPNNLFGIDLLPDRIETAKSLYPNMTVSCCNAEEIPYENSAFDMICCMTVFSSVLDENMRSNIAKEMNRVLKKGGFILWYDYFVNNPSNPDVRGVGIKHIRRLFPGYNINLRRITLAPPIVRLIAPASFTMCAVLESFRFLNTHFVGIIAKP